jgi:Flp pilus assembly protein TadD
MLAELGRYPEAEHVFREAIRLKRDLAKAHHELGVVLARLHRRAEAEAAFLTVLDKAAIAAGLADGDALNLDFHAVMH